MEANEHSWEAELLDSIIRMIEQRKMVSYDSVIHEIHLALASLEAGKLITKFYFHDEAMYTLHNSLVEVKEKKP
jgi:protocatechuate 3,4-dioxygenase beta subunit